MNTRGNYGSRGELGCAVLVIGALIIAALYVLSQAPWLLLAVPLALVAVVVALIFLAEVTSDDVLVTTDEPGGFTAWRLSILNSLRRSFHKTPLLQVPNSHVTLEERQMIKKAAGLATGMASALKSSAVPESERGHIQQQADDVPANMAKALWRLERLRHLTQTVDVNSEAGQRNRSEAQNLEKQILSEMQRGLDTLTAVPVSLMQVEMAQAGRPLERLLSDLGDSNQHLRDIASTYTELKTNQSLR